MSIFTITWALRPSWSCDLHHWYRLPFLFPLGLCMKIYLGLVKRFRRTRSLKMVNGRRMVYYKHDDSGELITSQSVSRASLIFQKRFPDVVST